MRGSIIKRGNSWTIRYDIPPGIDGKRRQARESLGNVTKRDAERILAERISEVSRGQYTNPTTMKLADYLEMWLDHAAQSLRDSTVKSYRSTLRNHVSHDIGHLKMNQLRPAHIQELYRQKLESGRSDGQGLSRRTVEYIHHTLHGALDQAVKWQILFANPADAVDPPRAEKPQIRYWSQSDARRFLEAIQGHRNAPLYRIALSTGLRQGELLALRWEDLRGDRLAVRRSLARDGTFTDTKTGSGRVVALDVEEVEVLRVHRVRQAEERLAAGLFWDDHGLIFPSSVGTPISHRNLLRQFKSMVKKHNLPPITFHDLRHTCATMLLEGGVNPKVVQERLGHSRISTTMDTYSHVSPDMQKGAAKVISDMLRAQSVPNR